MKYLYTGFPPLAYASASTQRLYMLDAVYLSPRRFFCALYMEYLPSLNKSIYGFCGHKYRPTLRVALTGASLPTAPRFLWRHFSRAKTPQDFSARENRMMTRKRTPAYWRMLLRGPRKVVRPRGERRSDEALEGCLFRRNSAPT